MGFLRRVDGAISKRKDWLLVGLATLVFLGLAVTGWWLCKEAVLPVLLTLLLAIVLIVQVAIYRRIQFQLSQPHENYRQVEALFSLFASVEISHPLPPMRAWAISPDFAVTIVSLIREWKPSLVLELGSGISTLVAAYCLRDQGSGRIVSFEDGKEFARASSEHVRNHGLTDIATVLHLPLIETTVDGEAWNWYDVGRLERNYAQIDMLIVDGPTGNRYPALPMLMDSLSSDAIVVVDDAYQLQPILDSWLQRYHNFEISYLSSEKGTAILRRRSG